MKGVGMLIVSLWGVNFGFWSHLGCSGKNSIIFSSEGLILGCTQRNIKIYIFVCVLTWSLLSLVYTYHASISTRMFTRAIRISVR